MQEIKKLLKLYIQSELSVRQIGHALTISKSTIGDYITRFKHSGLTLADLESKSESEIYALLFKEDQKLPKRSKKKVLPDFALIHLELKKKYVTRDLLWCEYKSTYPDNHYGYTIFAICIEPGEKSFWSRCISTIKLGKRRSWIFQV